LGTGVPARAAPTNCANSASQLRQPTPPMAPANSSQQPQLPSSTTTAINDNNKTKAAKQAPFT
jgi:hypothetical protein